MNCTNRTRLEWILETLTIVSIIDNNISERIGLSFIIWEINDIKYHLLIITPTKYFILFVIISVKSYLFAKNSKKKAVT